MRRPTAPLIAAVAFATLGILAGGAMLVQFSGRTTVHTPRGAPEDTARPTANDAVFLAVEPGSVDFIASSVSETIAFRAAETDLQDGDRLAEDAGRILRAWLGGSATDYLAYLEESGHTPPPAPHWNEPDAGDAAWLNSTRELRNAKIDPSGVELRASFRQGEHVDTGEKTKSITGWRMDKLSAFKAAAPSADQIASAGVDVYEVRVPIQAQGLRKISEYTGRLAMSYAKDQTTKRWTLVAVSVYDLPPDDTARIPPF